MSPKSRAFTTAWTCRHTIERMQTLNSIFRRIPVWAIYLLGGLPAPWLFYQGLTGGLGVAPIEALEHKYGELALQLLIVVLTISPARRLLGLNLLKFRRALGVLTFAYVSMHLLVWLVLDVQVPSQIWADIVKRPYITVGMAAFVLMLPLAVTSNNLSVRRLGARWRSLQRLVYPAAILGGLHYVMLAKGFQIEPVIYMSLIVGLLVLRLPVSNPLNRFRGADSA